MDWRDNTLFNAVGNNIPAQQIGKGGPAPSDQLFCDELAKIKSLQIVGIDNSAIVNNRETSFGEQIIKAYNSVRYIQSKNGSKEALIHTIIGLASLLVDPVTDEYVFPHLSKERYDGTQFWYDVSEESKWKNSFSSSQFINEILAIANSSEGEGVSYKQYIDQNPNSPSNSIPLDPLYNDLNARKICAYCYMLLTSAVKKPSTVQERAQRFDKLYDTFVTSSVSNIKIAQYEVNEATITTLGSYLRTNPSFRWIVIKSMTILNEQPGSNICHYLSALAMTRIVTHALPMYTLAVPILQKFTKISLIQLHRLITIEANLPTFNKVYSFMAQNNISDKDYKELAVKDQLMGARSLSKYWPIARVLNYNWLLGLGRKDNEESYYILFQIQKLLMPGKAETLGLIETPITASDKVELDKFSAKVLAHLRKTNGPVVPLASEILAITDDEIAPIPVENEKIEEPKDIKPEEKKGKEKEKKKPRF